MGLIKKLFSQLNFPGQCRRYGLELWQCPQFLFLVMGLIIIGASFVSYLIGSRYLADPQIAALSVIIVTAILFVIAVVVTRSFERLAQVSRMKSEFISVVSHQLRSPLSNLKWAIETLMSGRLGQIEEKQTEYFRILKENSARMTELVADLLIVSRLETATLAFNRTEVFLPDIARGLILGSKAFAQASNVEVELQAQEDLPRVMTDVSQIKLVMENFLDNAIRYVNNKGRVEVRIFRKDNYVRFEVKDNGVGIPEDDRKYIFQKFFRSENVLKYQTQGSGLGLYIARAIVKRSGGKIGFESQEGAGSTFWFSLPIKPYNAQRKT